MTTLTDVENVIRIYTSFFRAKFYRTQHEPKGENEADIPLVKQEHFLVLSHVASGGIEFLYLDSASCI